MGNWVSLKDVCSKGSSSLRQKDLHNAGRYPVYGAAGVVGFLDNYQYDRDYVAVIKDGAGVGRVLLCSAYSSVLGTLQPIIPNESITLSYLRFLLSGMHLADYSSGATIPHIYFKDYGESVVNLPDIEEQKAISCLFERILQQIKLAEQMLAKTDELIQSRFVEMFGDIQERTAVSHYVKSFSSGKSLASKEHCVNLVLKTSAVASNTFDETQVKYLPFDYVPNPDHEIKHGDVIINRKNTVQLVGSTGYVWQYPKNMYLSDLLWKANLDETTCNPIFLWQLLVNRSVHRRISAMATGANSSMANITKPNLMQLPVVLVPLALQNEFAEFVTQVESLKTATRQQLDRLNTLYDSLAQRYFAE